MLGCGRKTARSLSWEDSSPQKTLQKMRLWARILAILGVLNLKPVDRAQRYHEPRRVVTDLFK